jgi:ABC-type phosphate transport system substrate-binding protein
MSRTLGAPKRGLSAVWTGALAFALIAFAAVGLAPRADAAFSLSTCSGVEITGRGASFARDAHGVFNTHFHASVCPGTLADINYEPQGSGAGRTSMMVRNGTPRFGMSDEPPTPKQILQMNKGTIGDPNDPANPDVINTADDGLMHVVPAAVGAVAPLVNLPNGCTQEKINLIPTDPAQPVSRTTEQDRTTDGVPDGVVRLRFKKSKYEEIWAQGVTGPASYMKWEELVPAFAGTGATCGEMPVIRVVRFDESGTSFAFKDYLHTINEARGWRTTYSTVEPALTRDWPGATFGDRDDCGDKDGIAEASDPDGPGAPGLVADADNLTSSCSGNAANLVTKLIGTDGSVSYADISTARTAGVEVTPRINAGSAFDNDTYWTQVQNGSNEFTEPTSNQFGFRTDGAPGANCTQTTFKNVPASTLGSWANTSGVNSAAGYGICTLTYGLVFEDSSDVWGTGGAEQAKARTVKDYWTGIVSDTAQAQLPIKDYSPLPDAIQAIAAAGVAEVEWEKGVGGGGPGGGGSNNGGGNGSNGGGNPLPVKASNVFSLLRKSISSKTGGATVSVKLPGAGQLEVIGTAKNGKKTIKVGRTVLDANRAGTFNLLLKPSAAAKKILKEKGKLPVKLELVFTPDGGDEKSSTSSLTLKLTKKGK